MAKQLRNRNNLATWKSINHQPKFEKSLDLSLGASKWAVTIITNQLSGRCLATTWQLIGHCPFRFLLRQAEGVPEVPVHKLGI